MKHNETPPRVSIGMPVYRGEQYLGAAIDSILSQTFTDFELIISDNGSDDSTPEICRQYAARDRRIVIHLHETNRGGAWNFNFVFHEARGAHFKWACHDDALAPTYLERCVEVLEAHPDAVLCYPRTLMIGVGNAPPAPYPDDMHLVSPSPAVRFEQVLFRKSQRCHPAMGLIRRDALASTDLIGSYMSSDEILLAALALLGKYYEYPEALFFRRDHPNTSVRGNPTIHSRYTWYNPLNRSRVLLPTMRHFYEYTKCIWYSRIPLRHKIRCERLAFRLFRWRRGRLLLELKDSFRNMLPRGD